MWVILMWLFLKCYCPIHGGNLLIGFLTMWLTLVLVVEDVVNMLEILDPVKEVPVIATRV